MYDRWTEVAENTLQCHLCQKTTKNRKYLINHLATFHNQLEQKLKDGGETVEQYEMEIEDEDAAEDIDSYTATAVTEMELNHEDLFSEEDEDDKGSDKREDKDLTEEDNMEVE